MNIRVALALLIAGAACGGGKNSNVDSVQLLSANSNPRVGETVHVGATPVDAHGVQVPGVTCAFVSSNGAVASVDPGSGAVAALSPGVATITATCGGKAASVDITVRPNVVILTLQKLGNGSGALFANPPGSPNYEAATSVAITATPNSGSIFSAWGGACAATAPSSPCDLVLNDDATVTATFESSTTYATSYSGEMGAVTGVCGCGYSRSVSGQIILSLSKDAAGNVSGTGSAPSTLTTVVTSSPSGTTCSGGTFDSTPTGNVSGTAANLTGSFSDGSAPRPYQVTFTGAWNGTTVTGSVTVSKVFNSTGTCGPDEQFPQSATYGSLTLSQQ